MYALHLQATGVINAQKRSSLYQNTGPYALPGETADKDKDQGKDQMVSVYVRTYIRNYNICMVHTYVCTVYICVVNKINDVRI